MSQELSITITLANQYFDLSLTAEDTSYQRILRQLTTHIRYLLDHNFELLLQALYRIDVDEIKFREALELGEPHEVAGNIARLVLDRIVLKAKTRAKYSI